MKKSSFLLLMLGATASQAFASKGAVYVESVHQQQYFTGFYVTVAAGGTTAEFDIDQTFTAFVPTAVTLEHPLDATLQGSSAAGLLGLGYSYQFDNHFVIGAEITAGITDAEQSVDNTLLVSNFGINFTSTLEATLKNDFAVLFKPGYVFKEKTQLYALLGARWGNFNTSVETFFDYAPNPILSGDMEGEESGYELGFTAGLGIEHMLTEHFSLGLEYAYTTYGNINSPTADLPIPSTPDAGIITDEPDFKASSNTVLLALGYHF